MYTIKELQDILENLRLQPHEDEVVEFKEANQKFDFRKIGKYFSALSNEANLLRRKEAWLIFGIEDYSKKLVNTEFRRNSADLNSLKKEIADQTNGRITFREIFELQVEGKRVLMFCIPPAPQGIPVDFGGHYYARNHESLVPLNLEKLERIRNQITRSDWSSVIIEDAEITDLDTDAIQTARKNYKAKYSDKAAEVDTWDDTTFLNKAKITRKGKITRAALILLGKEESEHFLSPADCKIRWVLRNNRGDNLDYELFSCPFITSVERVYKKIRNLNYRYMKGDTIFPTEVLQYTPYLIREAINNCIAHQDYALNGRINVIEYEDTVVFTNKGAFIPVSVESVIENNAPEEVYRNPFLAGAMFNVGMVDTIGGGIRKMFKTQAAKFFPLPEYTILEDRVELEITGRVLDMKYANILAQKNDLTLSEIMMLDKVQKKKMLNTTEIKYLKNKKLIEGRKPNFFLSKEVAQKTGQKARYSKIKGLDNQYYLDFIFKAITEHKKMVKKEILDLMIEKLPENLNGKQKITKVDNILRKLREMNKIECIGTGKHASWRVKK